MATDTAHTGWAPDPMGRHEERYLILGEPTDLVRDRGVEDADPVDGPGPSPPGVPPPATAQPSPPPAPVEPPVVPVFPEPDLRAPAPEPEEPPLAEAERWTATAVPGRAVTPPPPESGPGAGFAPPPPAEGWPEGPPPAPQEGEVEVRLDGWQPGERGDLARALVEKNVPFTWLGTVVVVDHRDLETVERLRAVVRPSESAPRPPTAPGRSTTFPAPPGFGSGPEPPPTP